MTKLGEDDVALKFLHTADWHLGKRFAFLDERFEKKLTRARVDVLDKIFGTADHHDVDAVLCAGDLFDSPFPDEEWRHALLEKLKRLNWERPVFLLPGNHDPLLAESVWDEASAFRRGLPDFVHVVDRDDFEYELTPEARLYARPCRSMSGQDDLAMALPAREDGDELIRIGLVHGSTFDMEGCQTNFPIAKDAAVERGFDYLAIGDTHSFRFVPPDRPIPPTIYPGAPEPTAFEEKDPGHVALVFVTRHRRARVQKVPVARWHWEQAEVRSLGDLQALRDRRDLDSRVLRLQVEMSLAPHEYARAEQLLAELEGNLAIHGLVGILDLNRSGLGLDPSDIESAFDGAPAVVQAAAHRLKAIQASSEEPEVAGRALYRLYKLVEKAS